MTDQQRDPLDLYLIAVGGTGMAPLACLLKGEGHRVRGSDLALYPPMSTLLDGAGIHPHQGFDPAHLDPRPDLVVVGNAVPRDNPEALEAERLELPLVSMPQALARFFLAGRQPLVVAGAHGKTTTTAMGAWAYRQCGADPGFLIGGLPLDLPMSFHRGGGPRFIVEGDEYNAAYFDRGPKFLHYQAESLILTGVDYDHVDLYPDPELLTAAYRRLIGGLPPEGLLVACGDSPGVRDLAAEAPCRVLLYGLEADNDVRATVVESHGEGTRVEITGAKGSQMLDLALWGEHNACNATAIWAAGRADGLPADRLAEALSTFRGVHRRLEIVGRGPDVIVVDDFAHHPSEVKSSLMALRSRFPERRLLAVFEPRSLSAGRSLFRDSFLEALSIADRVFLAPVFHRRRLAVSERLDLGELCGALSGLGTAASCHRDLDEIFAAISDTARAGDVVVSMSSGSFGGLPQRLAAHLAVAGD